MRFMVTPHDIKYYGYKIAIATDDYSEDEIKDGRHIRDIKSDFAVPRIKADWHSNHAYIYPLTDSGVDTRHYLKIKV